MLKGLLIKEIIVLVKNNAFQLLMILMFAFLGIMLKNSIYLMFIPLLLPMLIIQGLAFDETSKWDKYSICFPVGRKKIVSSKYLMVTIAAVLAAGLVFVSSQLLKMRGAVMLGDTFFYLAGSASAALVMPSIVLPFDLKFGVAKGKTMYYIVTGLVVVTISAIVMNMGDDFQLSLPGGVNFPVLIMLGAALLLFAASWVISCIIYESKEL